MIVLLAVKPGPLLDGLDALLYATPGVQLVAHANDTNASLQFCEQHPTELIILEIKPGDRGLLVTVPEMKALCPQVQVVAMIHDEQDRRPAEEAGADVVLITGTPAVKLKEVLKEIVDPVVKE